MTAAPYDGSERETDLKLLTASTSPFSLKVLIVAHELGLTAQLEPIETHVRPHERNRSILDLNPLAQVPTLVLDDGGTLHDSRVICDYLNEIAGGAIVPASGPARWLALKEQSIADGILTAALVARYEHAFRPAELRWSAWLDGHIDKIQTGLAYIETHIPEQGRVDIGTISFACVMKYIDFRFPDLARREKYPLSERWHARFGERPSMRSKSLV